MTLTKRRKNIILISIILIAAALLVFIILNLFKTFNPPTYKNEDFQIEIIKSNYDKNNNGIDDYTDIMLGARQDAVNNPTYRSAYYEGGYPPDNEGVCTDLVWRAFKNAGYSLKDLVDKHIAENADLYPGVNGKPDPNIDFRRVRNLKVFFDYDAVSYSLNPYDIEEWQPGDIVIFGETYNHIGIISDKRNKEGVPYLIHNAGQSQREEDALLQYSEFSKITGHYRFENPDGIEQ